MAFIFFSFFKDDVNEANIAQEIPLKAGPVKLSLVCPPWLAHGQNSWARVISYDDSKILAYLHRNTITVRLMVN